MSVDYTVVVKRNKDNKKIAEFNCNTIKSLLDSQHNNVIHCEDLSYVVNSKFTPEELSNMAEMIYKEIDKQYAIIEKNNLLILNAKNLDVAHEYKAENEYIRDYIESELRWQYSSACKILGKIECVVEDLYRGDEPAYTYNAEGLDVDTIWCKDIYCEVISS